MSLYIDYDETVSAPLWDFKCSIDDKYASGYFDALDDAMELLSKANGVEIIFCKDCRYFRTVLSLSDSDAPQGGVCAKLLHKTTRSIMAVQPNSFCCFAKRKDEAN